MSKLYYRYGRGKTSDLCQTAYNFNEQGMKVITMNALDNKKIVSKVTNNGRNLLTRDINYKITDNSIFKDLYEIDNISCILVDNAHLLNKKQVLDLFYIANLLNITVIAYGDRTTNGKATEGSMRLMELSNVIEQVDGNDFIPNSKFQFYYGAMNCSKTAKLLYKSYALEAEGLKTCLIKPKIDRDVKYIESRIGLKEKADIILDANDSIYGEGIYMAKNHVNYILVDEAQFLSIKQINELYRINKELDIPVRCYGLKIDFMSNHFPGSGRLLELSDELVKMKTVCPCGEGADFNARKNKEGLYVNSGNQVSIDNGENDTYTSLCPKCYIASVWQTDKEKILSLK